MRALFVDTGVWLAFLDAADPLHARARTVIEANRSYPFLSTDLVLSETVTMIRRELGPDRAGAFGREFLEGKIASLIRPEPEDWQTGLALICKYTEQKLSLADAVSIAVIQRMRIERAAAFDKHFRIILTGCEVFGRTQP